MDKLWAPWRVKYVTKLIGKTKKCVFCRILREKNDKKNFVFLHSRYCFAVLNIYPYNNGHSLVMPYRHINDLNKLTAAEEQDLWKTLAETRKLLDKVLNPKGYNIGINLGRAAGAGFPGRIHTHIVPRWSGDVNFMPVTAGTKVISQSLQALWAKLMAAQKKAYRKR